MVDFSQEYNTFTIRQIMGELNLNKDIMKVDKLKVFVFEQNFDKFIDNPETNDQTS